MKTGPLRLPWTARFQKKLPDSTVDKALIIPGSVKESTGDRMLIGADAFKWVLPQNIITKRFPSTRNLTIFKLPALRVFNAGSLCSAGFV